MAVPLFRWRRVLLVPDTHPLAGLQRAPTLARAVIERDGARVRHADGGRRDDGVDGTAR